MISKSSKFFICIVMIWTLFIVSSSVAVAEPVHQTAYRYNFVGQVTDAEHARAVPERVHQPDADGDQCSAGGDHSVVATIAKR
ncbi:MAG: hypothetical protein JXA33_21025 [Anaerolineae bacterium]|nr:hypothetical protein [Anaerolineae bacterium]